MPVSGLTEGHACTVNPGSQLIAVRLGGPSRDPVRRREDRGLLLASWSAAQFSDGSPEAIQRTVDEWGHSHPLGRVARPDEVAQVISFLASERASFVTGEDIRVDGGLLASVAVRLPAQDR
ncbi:MAG TPA: SDR family oxidoreductase [Trebonia sp.]|jgi:NAD(P)-dependent dehydrogenase (short-subunit alcohol dehydrogenase family)